MASPCLSTLKSERHSVQLLGVTMIEEKLQDHKKKLIEAVAAADTADRARSIKRHIVADFRRGKGRIR